MIYFNPKTHLPELIDRVIEIEWSYAIWQSLIESHAQNERAISDHRDFFESVARTHLQSLLVNLHAVLSDDSKGVFSFRKLVAATKLTYPEFHKSASGELSKIHALLAKIKTLRDTIFAHRFAAMRPEQVFNQVGLSKTELKEVVDALEQLTAGIAEAVTRGKGAEIAGVLHQRHEYAKSDLSGVFAQMEAGYKALRAGMMAAATRPTS